MGDSIIFLKPIAHNAGIPEEKFDELANLHAEMQRLEVIPSIDLDPPRDYFNVLAEIKKDRVCGWLDGGMPGCVADVYAEEVEKFNESNLKRNVVGLSSLFI